MRSRSGDCGAFLQADSFHREVYLHAPAEWCPQNPNRVWKLDAPAYGLNDATVAFHRPLKRYLLKHVVSLKVVGLKYTASNLDPCLYMVFNRKDEATGVFSSRIGDISGCDVPGVLERTRYFSEQRFGALQTQENDFVQIGAKLSQRTDFSVDLTPAEFTHQLQPSDTSPALRKARQRSLSDEEKLKCQCKLGELRWLATVSRPDTCARFTQWASKVNESQGSDVYRMNDLVKAEKNGSLARSKNAHPHLFLFFPLGRVLKVVIGLGGSSCVGDANPGRLVGYRV